MCGKKNLFCGPIYMSLILLAGAEPEFVYRLDYRGGALKSWGGKPPQKNMNSAACDDGKCEGYIK